MLLESLLHECIHGLEIGRVKNLSVIRGSFILFKVV